jgi:hypothetical protein
MSRLSKILEQILRTGLMQTYNSMICDTAKDEGRPIPEPKGRLIYA